MVRSSFFNVMGKYAKNIFMWLSACNMQIVHIAGKLDPVADVLSRWFTVPIIPGFCCFHELDITSGELKAQINPDVELSKICNVYLFIRLPTVVNLRNVHCKLRVWLVYSQQFIIILFTKS